jgi:hypothetical protein
MLHDKTGNVGRRSWDTPPRYVLRDVSLSADGASIRFVECERTWHPVEPARQNARRTRVESTISGCSAPQRTILADVEPAALW